MRVLLVEDHLQLAESVAQALKSTGLTVDVLHDGVAADLAPRGGNPFSGALRRRLRVVLGSRPRPVSEPPSPYATARSVASHRISVVGRSLAVVRSDAQWACAAVRS